MRLYFFPNFYVDSLSDTLLLTCSNHIIFLEVFGWILYLAVLKCSHDPLTHKWLYPTHAIINCAVVFTEDMMQSQCLKADFMPFTEREAESSISLLYNVFILETEIYPQAWGMV